MKQDIQQEEAEQIIIIVKNITIFLDGKTMDIQ